VASTDGTQLVEAERSCAGDDIDSAETLGREVADLLTAQGARALLPTLA
jgi:hypothetical protein